MYGIFDKIEKLMEIGKVVEKRIREGKLQLSENTEELKKLIKLKTDLLTYKNESNIVKLEKKDSDFELICDLLTLLYKLLEVEEK